MPVQHTPVYVTEAERLEQENAARQVRDLPERPPYLSHRHLWLPDERA